MVSEAVTQEGGAITDFEANIERIYLAQKAAYRAHPMPSAEERQQHLALLKKALLEYKERLLEAIDEDFGGRSKTETMIAEFLSSLEGIKYYSKNLRKWMRPSRRHVPLQLQPAKAEVQYQPVGVVGIIAPWNYPILLALSPLTCALAAGNRAMLKLSEFTPRTSEVTKEMLASVFSEDHVAVITGEAEVGIAFSKVPFDHLLFTGSTAVGRHVMRAAADNLTPVTLELGGKSPAIVSKDVPIADAVERICFGKSLNAGQTCIAPDYVLCPRDKQKEFVEAYRALFNKMYPDFAHNEDYTSVVNDRQFNRLQRYVTEAREKGAEVEIVGGDGDWKAAGGNRRMPLHILKNVSDDMEVMQEEIFGPILPLVPYDKLDEAIDYINDRERPLALYYFGYDKSEQQHVLTHTHSGGACVNETLMHVAMEDLPFGGIGPSGMGHYHGYEGFLTFSKAKGIVSKQRFNSTSLIFPPYKNNKILDFLLGWLVR